MPEFGNFLDTLKDNIKKFAEDKWKSNMEDVLSDGSKFLNKTKEDLKRWTDLLSEGQLTNDDFKFLVLAKKDLAEMEALRQAGLALVEIDKCRQGILNLVVGTALDFFV